MPLTNLEFAHKRLFKRACDYVDRQAGDAYLSLPINGQLVGGFFEPENNLLGENDLSMFSLYFSQKPISDIDPLIHDISSKLLSRLSRLVIYPDRSFRQNNKIVRGYGVVDGIEVDGKIIEYVNSIGKIIIASVICKLVAQKLAV
jgi:hypothetical protein